MWSLVCDDNPFLDGATHLMLPYHSALSRISDRKIKAARSASRRDLETAARWAKATQPSGKSIQFPEKLLKVLESRLIAIAKGEDAE